MTVVAAMHTVPRPAAAAMLGERHWRVAAIALLSVRFIQGFIYWGEGSRRFIYGPEKLIPDAPAWMANKFQSAMPGALFGTDHLIAFLLHHFWLLYPAVILFSGAELISDGANGRAADAPHGAGLGWLLDSADADVRLAGCYLHRRMDDGRL